MSRLIHKSHNVSILLYHMVCVAKYRRVIFDASVEEALREVCLEIALRYEIEFHRDWLRWRSCSFSGSERFPDLQPNDRS